MLERRACARAVETLPERGRARARAAKQRRRAAEAPSRQKGFGGARPPGSALEMALSSKMVPFPQKRQSRIEPAAPFAFPADYTASRFSSGHARTRLSIGLTWLPDNSVRKRLSSYVRSRTASHPNRRQWPASHILSHAPGQRRSHQLARICRMTGDALAHFGRER
jgi:hypothetical protein